MAQKHVVWLLLVEFLVLLVTKPVEGKVSAIIVFGDSTVDTGNNNKMPTIAKSNFEPYGRDFDGGRPTGRFSNGRIFPDFISEGFRLKPVVPAYLDPMYNISDFTDGACFASAGSGYDNSTSDLLNVITLWKELENYKDYQKNLRAYLGEEKANEIISEALYLISTGTNDFIANYYLLPGRRSQFTVQQYEDFLIGIARNFFTQLYGLGARKIALTLLPPMGCIPIQRSLNLPGNDCVKKYNDVAVEFNKKLIDLALDLNKELDGIKIVIADSYDIALEVIEKPASYGFEVASKGCCGIGTLETKMLFGPKKWTEISPKFFWTLGWCGSHTTLPHPTPIKPPCIRHVAIRAYRIGPHSRVALEIGFLCAILDPFTCKDANKYVFWDSFHPTEKTNRIVSEHILPTLSAEFL